MNERIRTIIEATRQLSSEERLDLFDQLYAEFGDEADQGTPEEIEAAWMEEVERRIAAFERGESGPGVPFDAVMARARALVDRDR